MPFPFIEVTQLSNKNKDRTRTLYLEVDGWTYERWMYMEDKIVIEVIDDDVVFSTVHAGIANIAICKNTPGLPRATCIDLIHKIWKAMDER